MVQPWVSEHRQGGECAHKREQRGEASIGVSCESKEAREHHMEEEAAVVAD